MWTAIILVCSVGSLCVTLSSTNVFKDEESCLDSVLDYAIPLIQEKGGKVEDYQCIQWNGKKL